MHQPMQHSTALQKIMRALRENNSLGKTQLAKKTNIHYSRMMKELNRLELDKFTRLEIKEGKVQVTLTKKGNALARRLLSLDEEHTREKI